MNEYLLIYLPEAEERLLEMFFEATDRRRFENASHTLERRLRADPWAVAEHLSEGLYTADEGPLRVVFEVRARDNTVLIVHVGEAPPPSPRTNGRTGPRRW